MTSVEEIEELIKPFLLTDITFTLESKKLKQGKLILFAIRDFFCVFTIFDPVKNKKTAYEIPYPFNIEVTPNELIFNYTIEAFSEKSVDIKEKLKTTKFKKVSKMFNKKVIVSKN